jgi:riboflavin kinase
VLQRLVLKGIVFSGTGEGKKFIDLPWVKKQIEEKLRFTPYSGTLNLHLTTESADRKMLLEKAEGQRIEPQPGYCRGVMFKAYVNSLESAVILPEIRSYPKDVLEVIAPVYLRGHLNLVDGSVVTVSVAL